MSDDYKASDDYKPFARIFVDVFNKRMDKALGIARVRQHRQENDD